MNFSEYVASHPGYREIKNVSTPDPALKINLVLLQTDFAAESLNWLQKNPEIGKLMGDDFSNLSLEGERKRIQDILSSKDEYSWCIKDHDHIIGNVSINFIAEKTKLFGVRTGSIAIIIWDKSCWNRKVARSVNAAILDWAFNEGGFEVMVCRIFSHNIASIKSFIALRFEEDGTEIDGTAFWNKYKLTKEHWQELKAGTIQE